LGTEKNYGIFRNNQVICTNNWCKIPNVACSEVLDNNNSASIKKQLKRSRYSNRVLTYTSHILAVQKSCISNSKLYAINNRNNFGNNR